VAGSDSNKELAFAVPEISALYGLAKRVFEISPRIAVSWIGPFEGRESAFEKSPIMISFAIDY
jgi:hypothetical protein